jgi:hypothetical protein
MEQLPVFSLQGGNALFFTSSSLALGPTQLPSQRVLGAKLTVQLHLCLHFHVHGMVLN